MVGFTRARAHVAGALVSSLSRRWLLGGQARGCWAGRALPPLARGGGSKDTRVCFGRWGGNAEGAPGSSTPPVTPPASVVSPVEADVASWRRPQAYNLPDCDTAIECMVPHAICRMGRGRRGERGRALLGR